MSKKMQKIADLPGAWPGEKSRTPDPSRSGGVHLPPPPPPETDPKAPVNSGGTSVKQTPGNSSNEFIPAIYHPSESKTRSSLESVKTTTPAASALPASFLEQREAVKKMQDALLEFKSQAEKKLPSGQGDAGSVTNAVLKNYIKPSSNLASPAQDGKAPEVNFSDLTAMLGHIGSAKAAASSDGIWGPNTNKALHAVASVMRGVLSYQTAMGFPNNTYSDEKVNAFESAIPADAALKTMKLTKLAEDLTKEIQQMKSALIEFQRNTVDNEKFRGRITQTEAVHSIDAVDAPKVGQIDLKTQNQVYQIPEVGRIRLSDMWTAKAFNDWMAANKRPASQTQELLAKIKAFLDANSKFSTPG